MVRTFLKVYMELGSSFLFLQEQIKDIIIITKRVLFVLEFKRTLDQRRDYRDRGESRAMAQHDILIRSLEREAGAAKDIRKKQLFFSYPKRYEIDP